MLAAGLLLVSVAARADGGRLQLNQVAGPFEIALFTSPTPLHVGPVEVNVLVQTAAGHTPLMDAQVTVAMRPVNAADKRTATAVLGGATNKLLYTAVVEVPAPGRWSLTADVRSGEQSASVSCDVDVAPPLSPFAAFWAYLALPAVVIALFVLHQWLKRSAVRRQSSVVSR